MGVLADHARRLCSRRGVAHWKAGKSWAGRTAALWGLLVPAAFAWWPAVGEWPVRGPGLFGIALATALGMPIFAAIGGAACLLFWYDMTPIASVPTETYRLAASPMLPAIPLFTLAGYLLAEGEASDRLTRLFPVRSSGGCPAV
ncbi:MAG: hypothetical protein R2724_25475 [Bryobacterales bacterium]